MDKSNDVIPDNQRFTDEGKDWIRSLEVKRSKIVDKYPIDKLSNFSVNDYAVGKSDNSLCAMISDCFTEYLKVREPLSVKYLLYYDTDINEYVADLKRVEDVGEAYEKVKEVFDQVQRLKNKSDLIATKYNLLFVQLVAIYHPEWIIPIFDKQEQKYYLEKLKLDCSGDYFKRNETLLDYMVKEKPYFSCPEFAAWLRNEFRYAEYMNNIEDTETKVYFADSYGFDLIENENITYNDAPVNKIKRVRKHYPRDRKVVREAKRLSGGYCELCSCTNRFYKPNGDFYLEGHHLIPISKFAKFDYSLDVPANMIMLCSNCHNEMHYGAKRLSLIEKAYSMRCKRLEACKIWICIHDLEECY